MRYSAEKEGGVARDKMEKSLLLQSTYLGRLEGLRKERKKESDFCLEVQTVR